MTHAGAVGWDLLSCMRLHLIADAELPETFGSKGCAWLEV